MTFSFEMRSGREHNTPDKAMWGFHVTVRAQVHSICKIDCVNLLCQTSCHFNEEMRR